MKRMLWVVLGVMLGILMPSRSVQVTAQEDQLPFAVGDVVTLHYDREVSCRVAVVRGHFVRCQSNEKQLTWWNVRTVTRVDTAVVR